MMRDDYLQSALRVITDPTILINVVSRRVKQLRRGNRALVESLEKLSAEDTALREIAEGKIGYELGVAEEETPFESRRLSNRPASHPAAEVSPPPARAKRPTTVESALPVSAADV